MGLWPSERRASPEMLVWLETGDGLGAGAGLGAGLGAVVWTGRLVETGAGAVRAMLALDELENDIGFICIPH